MKSEKETKITNEEFEKRIDQIFSYMKAKLLEKNKVYGSASFEGGMMAVIGNAFRMRDKSNRQMYLIRKLIEENSKEIPFGESLWDTICDEFGYATIGLTLLILLEEQGKDFFDFKIENPNNVTTKNFSIPEDLLTNTEDNYDPFGYPGDETEDFEVYHEGTYKRGLEK